MERLQKVSKVIDLIKACYMWIRATTKAGCLPFLLLSGALRLGAAEPVDLTRQQWNGNAICYSGYRAGQDPDKQAFPSASQVLEDLRILSRHWRLIRLYGSDRHSKDVLETIRKHKLPIQVMLGIWLSGKPEKAAENVRQVSSGIELARTFPGIVVAVSVGNEALVSWSDHRMTEAGLIELVRQVKGGVKCAVTVADDYLYWIQEGNRLVQHLDFITLHSYPLWGNQGIEQGLSSTIEKFESVRRAYPGKTIVFGEVGWASYAVGEKHAPGAGSEANQKRYFEEINDWARRNQVTAFFFEAFDEPWKGEGTEGHWGVFSEGRKAKPAVQGLYPDLVPVGSPSKAGGK